MADGYARYCGKPQCVIVHVDVGTQGLAAGLHNASCGRAPVLIFAGLSPYTIEGEERGSRTEWIHWLQDVPDQKAIVGQYCRYTGEIKTGKNVKVDLALLLPFLSLTNSSKLSTEPSPSLEAIPKDQHTLWEQERPWSRISSLTR